MLAPFLEDSEWDKRRLALIHQHHQERVDCFNLEDESWQTLERAHHQQLLQSPATSLSTRAKLVRQQTQTIADWRREKEANRQRIKVRQAQEMADLNRPGEA